MERIIHIFWDGPFRYNELNKLNNEEEDYGLYQVYAHHAVYGSGALVYIGQAFNQTFYKRIGQHKWETGSEPDPENLAIYVGRLRGEESILEDEWKKEIYLAEKLLIHEHAPAYNSTHMMAINNESEIVDVRVINFGTIRSLRREVSGYLSGDKARSLNQRKPYKKHCLPQTRL